MVGNCHGARLDGTVRPLALCLKCAHWLSIAGERVTPLIQVRHDGAQLILLCGRRQAVKD